MSFLSSFGNLASGFLNQDEEEPQYHGNVGHVSRPQVRQISENGSLPELYFIYSRSTKAQPSGSVSGREV